MRAITSISAFLRSDSYGLMDNMFLQQRIIHCSSFFGTKPGGKKRPIIGYFMGNKWLSFSSSGRSSETMSRSHLTRPPSKLTFSTAPPKDSIFCPKKNLEEPEDKKTLNFLFRDTSKGSHQSCPFNFEGISKSTTLNRHTDTQGVSFFVVARISHLLSFHMWRPWEKGRKSHTWNLVVHTYHHCSLLPLKLPSEKL